MTSTKKWEATKMCCFALSFPGLCWLSWECDISIVFGNFTKFHRLVFKLYWLVINIIMFKKKYSVTTLRDIGSIKTKFLLCVPCTLLPGSMGKCSVGTHLPSPLQAAVMSLWYIIHFPASLPPPVSLFFSNRCSLNAHCVTSLIQIIVTKCHMRQNLYFWGEGC